MTQSRYLTSTVGAAALSQFALVKTPGATVVTAADTDVAYGVIQTDAAAGADALHCTFGPTKAIGSGIINAGARICPDAAGKVKAAAVGDLVCGYAETASGADGDILEIFFIPPTSVVLA